MLNSPTNLVDPSGLFEDFPTDLGAPFDFPSIPVNSVPIQFEITPGPDPYVSIWWWVDRMDLATRGLGLLRAGAGIVQVGGAAAIAGWTSGLALPLSLTVGASGALDLEVGVRQFLSGEPESSALSLGLQSVGIDPEVAELLDVARSMAGTMGAGAAASLARSGAALEISRDSTSLPRPITGREPASVAEQMVMRAAMEGEGTVIMRGPFADTLYQAPGWVKMQVVGRGTESNITVHFMKNLITGETSQYKFLTDPYYGPTRWIPRSP